MPQDNKIALLIDCDNVSHKSIEGVIDELSKYGKVNVRHAYGNWKSESMKGWEEKLHPHAIKPIQQFTYLPVYARIPDGTFKTYSNGCTACSDVNVVAYTNGSCE